MFQCQTCQSDMKPLFTGWFCPKDCDRPVSRSTPPPSSEYGKFLYQHRNRTTGRLWDVYSITSVPSKSILGWIIDKGNHTDMSFDSDSLGYLGEFKSVRIIEKYKDDYFSADSAYEMLRFIPLELEDRKKYNEYL